MIMPYWAVVANPLVTVDLEAEKDGAVVNTVNQWIRANVPGLTL